MAGEAPQVGSGDEIVRPLHHICATAALECRPAPVYMLIHMWVTGCTNCVSLNTPARGGEGEGTRIDRAATCGTALMQHEHAFSMSMQRALALALPPSRLEA
jgi:hypothetical protein